ncbi:MOSC domain-containing protein [Agaribacter flavus]|uniref:MOSC domain-containing protein n=1 Tax=Agaribacter flavus TaxID=1902781 RepID=A0ABV7FIW7_9ALTE
MKITRLFIYPVKSLQGIELSQATLQTEGFPYDREWMLVDKNGYFVTQRQLPLLATISTKLSKGKLILSNKLTGQVTIPLANNEERNKISVRVWSDQVYGFDEGVHVSEWLTETVGLFRRHALRLIRFDRQHKRELKKKYLFDEELANTYFADGFPYLITSMVSLQAVNTLLVEQGYSAIGIERFRPNIVIDNCESAFHELFYQNCSDINGQFQLSIRKPCERCPVTTIDQLNGDRLEPSQPLGVLRELNPMRDHPGAFFGGNAILTKGEGCLIQVGDTLLND